MAAVAGVGEDALDLGADRVFHRGNDRCQRVPVIGVAGKGHGVQGKLAALRALQRGGDGDFARRIRRARAPSPCRCTRPHGRASCRYLAAALTLPLFENGRGLVERPLEDRVQLRIVGDLALDVADDPPEIGLQFAQGLAGPLELLGVRIALMLKDRFGPDAPAMRDDILPRLRCDACGGKNVDLTCVLDHSARAPDNPYQKAKGG